MESALRTRWPGALRSVGTLLLAAALTASSGCRSAREAQRESAALALISGVSQEAFERIIHYEAGQSRRDFSILEAQLRAATPLEREALEARLAQALEAPEATIESKRAICRILRTWGADRSLSALLALLDDPSLSHMARYALEGKPQREIDVALRSALDRTEGETRLGIIAAIAARRDCEAVGALARLARQSDATLAEAALRALGSIGTPEAATAIEESGVEQALESERDDALLRCADAMVSSPESESSGSASEALRLYTLVLNRANRAPARIAALNGIVRAEGLRAVPTVLALLSDKDQTVREAAAQSVSAIPGRSVTRNFVAELPGMPPALQVVLLGALAERGDRAAAPDVGEFARNPKADGGARLAALEAMATLGSAEDVAWLAQIAAQNEPSASAAASALQGMNADGVDLALGSAMRNAEVPTRVALIRAMVARGHPDSRLVLLRYADARDEAVRAAAIAGLADLGDERDLPGLAALLAKTENDSDRTQAEKAFGAIARRWETGTRATPILLSALEEARAPGHCALLRLLAGSRGEGALGAIETALKAKDPDVRSTAMRLLADWPTTEPMDTLERLARSAPEDLNRWRALRGFIRMIGLPSDRKGAATLALYEKAMALADRAEERNLVLQGVGEVALFDAFDYAARYLESPGLSAEAQTAYLKIAEALAPREPRRVKVALGFTLAQSKDESFRERGRKVLHSIDTSGSN